ncbi:complex I NDUFA9 subunit family protein [Shimia thalassica]|uniref:complex I NDUFA9 subunit family protein n=1 Tax=Shimia thalassica TaxID=1715693 RepID=UPI0026E41EDF|nr:complex I NDUFA9 subunit family protein [Shimia thalassica]MDO6480842.1 complex I NDUFA9 subunit family protein [Shimia thalassica]
MSKLVTIYGGSGFVGRHIARLMAKKGWRVRVAVRRPNEAMFVRTYGDVGQVEPVLCNIRDDASVAAAMQGADAVVNCVGVLSEHRKNTFEAVQEEGADRVARLAAVQGVANMVQLSALGADATSNSQYAQTKAAGEAAVLKHMPNAMILRPSVIFGTDDEFFNRFASMSRMGPALVIAGGGTKFQPVFVEDVAAAAVKGITGEASGLYELGGPDVRTLRDWMHEMLSVVHRRRAVVNMPFFMAGLMAGVLDISSKMVGGVFENKILTRDQVKLLRTDNVVSEDAKTLADLGIEATNTRAVLADYLWRFRPSGQYDAIKDSAKNMRV